VQEVKNKMSIDEEIGKIPQQKLASDMPDAFRATVLRIYKDVKKGQYAGAPIVRFDLKLDNGEAFTTSYRQPKAWTGKGQLDKLMEHLKTLGLTLDVVVDKTFDWKREELSGSVKGNPRHYPIRLVGPKKVSK
jgi:hypothetical protein